MFMYVIINLVNKRGRKTMILNTIKIKGKEVYLMTDINTGQFKWTKKKSEAIAFNTDKQAKDFGKKYFKNFKNWETTDLEIEFN